MAQLGLFALRDEHATHWEVHTKFMALFPREEIEKQAVLSSLPQTVLMGTQGNNELWKPGKMALHQSTRQML